MPLQRRTLCKDILSSLAFLSGLEERDIRKQIEN
jgi:hypothetical protein